MQAESDVLRIALAGERSAGFAGFFERENRGLLKFLYFVTGNAGDAADLMQDAFLRVWERWDRIQTVDDPQAYLYRVALNGSSKRVRSLQRAARRVVTPDSVPDAFAEVDQREDVQRLLRSLAPRQRAALVLVDMYGYSSEAAGRIMRIRPSTVRALATQARASIRKAGIDD
jgi:RNA polymerase sigma factor (sigma-70 family)